MGSSYWVFVTYVHDCYRQKYFLFWTKDSLLFLDFFLHCNVDFIFERAKNGFEIYKSSRVQKMILAMKCQKFVFWSEVCFYPWLKGSNTCFFIFEMVLDWFIQFKKLKIFNFSKMKKIYTYKNLKKFPHLSMNWGGDILKKISSFSTL